MVDESMPAMEKLRKEAVRGAVEKKEGQPAFMVVLSGKNPLSRKLLLGQDFIIRQFPFTIGRRRSVPMLGSVEPELSIDDQPPFRISRRHLSLHRDNRGIWIVDEKSASGTILDGKRLVANQAVLIEPGRHELILGGSGSPYMFDVMVVEDIAESLTREDKVILNGKEVAVSLLYFHLYEYTRELLQVFSRDASLSFSLASDITDYILKHRDTLDPLYYYSTIPTVADDLIANHTLNVFLYTMRLSLLVGMSADTARMLSLAALFHDVGMYKVPSEVVEKKDTLTTEEFEIIKSHSLQGKELTESLAEKVPLIPAVAYEHHERIDGSGYPRGLKDISPYVELVGMVDFFEAITHYRPQRGPITPHEGMKRIVNMKDAIFRLENLKVFIQGFSLYPVYSIVRLNTGEIGQVVEAKPDYPLRPVVRVFFDRFGEQLREPRDVDLAANNNLYIRQDISDRIFIDRYFPLSTGVK